MKHFMRATFNLPTWRKYHSPLLEFFTTNLMQKYYSLLFTKLISFLKLFKWPFTPFFTFSFFKVEKYIRKYSRGKSGKYKLKWFFIPPYKRLNFLIRIFSGEIRSSSIIGLYNRFFNNLDNFFFKPLDLNFIKIHKFIYTYILKNFRSPIVLRSMSKFTRLLPDLTKKTIKLKVK